MDRIRRSWIAGRLLLPAALLLWLAGCHKWVPVEQPGAAMRQQTEADESDTYRLRLSEGTTLEGKVVSATEDSVTIRTSNPTIAETRMVTVGGADIEAVDVRRTKVLATVLLTAGLVAAPFVIYGIGIVIACAGNERCLT